MALSTPAERELKHTRTIVCEGFYRQDGDWDIEARIVDAKPYEYDEPERGHRVAGASVHDMSVRLTMSAERVIRQVEVDMPSTPYSICDSVKPAYQGLVGQQIGAGWRRAVNEAVGGTLGCTHVRELLFPMATVAFQAISGGGKLARPKHGTDEAAQARPFAINGCKAWADNGPMVARYFPKFAIKPAN